MALRTLAEPRWQTTSDSSRSPRPCVPETDRVQASSAIRPYLLAALLDLDQGLDDRPALVVTADDVGARDLARELGAYLAPRRVRYYPSRGTGYESHLAPPPHLVGLRIGALDSIAAEQAAGEEPQIVVASAVALAEAVPDASLRPAGFVLHRGRRSISATSPSCWSRRATSAPIRSRCAASSRSAATSSTSSARPRSAPRGWSCSATRSSRSAGSRPSPSARSGEIERLELDPAAELALEHRELAEVASEDARAPGRRRVAPGRLLPRAARPDLGGDRDPARRGRGDPGGASRPLGGRDHGDARRRRPAPLRRRRRADRQARAARIRGTAEVDEPGSGVQAQAADLDRAQHRRSGGAARARAALRLPGRRQLRQSRRSRAHPLQPQPHRRRLPRSGGGDDGSRRLASRRRRSPTASSPPT